MCAASSQGEACHAGFLIWNWLFIIIREAWDLTVTEDGCGTFQVGLGPYFECHFLVSGQSFQPASTETSPCWHRTFQFLPLTFGPSQRRSLGHTFIVMGSRFSVELMLVIAMGFRPAARFSKFLVLQTDLLNFLCMTPWVTVLTHTMMMMMYPICTCSLCNSRV